MRVLWYMTRQPVCCWSSNTPLTINGHMPDLHIISLWLCRCYYCIKFVCIIILCRVALFSLKFKFSVHGFKLSVLGSLLFATCHFGHFWKSGVEMDKVAKSGMEKSCKLWYFLPLFATFCHFLPLFATATLSIFKNQGYFCHFIPYPLFPFFKSGVKMDKMAKSGLPLPLPFL